MCAEDGCRGFCTSYSRKIMFVFFCCWTRFFFQHHDKKTNYIYLTMSTSFQFYKKPAVQLRNELCDGCIASSTASDRCVVDNPRNYLNPFYTPQCLEPKYHHEQGIERVCTGGFLGIGQTCTNKSVTKYAPKNYDDLCLEGDTNNHCGGRAHGCCAAICEKEC